ncbi:MAG: hypothetical protein U0X92_04475 [Anaerolineales bacterium]
MAKFSIPPQWDLEATLRYKRQNMERAMKGDITRGLVELITNADDSYRDMAENNKHPSGKIRIEIERRRKGQSKIVVVRDRAGGMSREELFEKMGGLGRRTSGFEKGKKRRGLLGRGAKDVAAFGTVHFESIKNDEYNHLIIPHSLKCRFDGDKPLKATSEIRERLHIPKGNGTVVTIEVNSQFIIPNHAKLVGDFSRYYSLRDIFSNSNRTVVMKDLSQNREDPLIYKNPDGQIIFNEDFVVPSYPKAIAHLIIRKHETPFSQERLPYREGVLVKSSATIHDCTYFNLESEPLAWRFTGELRCDYIDQLILEYEDQEEANPDSPSHPPENPTRLLDPSRDGLIGEHPFIQKLYKNGTDILRGFIDELKATEETKKRDVVDDNLNKKLKDLSKEVSKLFESKLRELEEDETTTPLDESAIFALGAGLHIIPPSVANIFIDQSKTFSVIIKHYEPIDPSLTVEIVSSNPDIAAVRLSPIHLKKISDDGTIARTTFTIDGLNLGNEIYIEARSGIYENLLTVNVITPPEPALVPDGLTFEKSSYVLQVNKEKSITLRLKTMANPKDKVFGLINSDNPEIVVKGGGKIELKETSSPNVWMGVCRITGRRAKDKGIITARISGYEPAQTHLVVEIREPKSGIDIKTLPVEEDFGSVRYKWDLPKDPYLLFIGAKHSSIRRYLGTPQNGTGYSGVNDVRYHIVLAEVVAEALAFKILEKEFRRKGQGALLSYADTDFHFHRHYSDFLEIAHKCLTVNTETA